MEPVGLYRRLLGVSGSAADNVFAVGAEGAILHLGAGPSGVPKASQFALGQNTPNPFNPATTIALSLESVSYANLTIYDLAGRRVRTLLDAWTRAGEVTVRWDGADQTGRAVASGTYVYRLRAGLVDEARKMTLVR